MKNTILAFGVGIFIGRYIYINYDKKEARRKEAQIKARLVETLENLGLSKREVKSRSHSILKK